MLTMLAQCCVKKSEFIEKKHEMMHENAIVFAFRIPFQKQRETLSIFLNLTNYFQLNFKAIFFYIFKEHLERKMMF